MWARDHKRIGLYDIVKFAICYFYKIQFIFLINCLMCHAGTGYLCSVLEYWSVRFNYNMMQWLYAVCIFHFEHNGIWELWIVISLCFPMVNKFKLFCNIILCELCEFFHPVWFTSTYLIVVTLEIRIYKGYWMGGTYNGFVDLIARGIYLLWVQRVN